MPNILKNYGCISLKTPPKSPWCNPHVERFNRTLKDELLYRVAILDNQHVQQLCGDFKYYYNTEQPHQGINGKIPNLSAVHVGESPNLDDLKVEKIPSLNGLVTKFKLVA